MAQRAPSSGRTPAASAISFGWAISTATAGTKWWPATRGTDITIFDVDLAVTCRDRCPVDVAGSTPCVCSTTTGTVRSRSFTGIGGGAAIHAHDARTLALEWEIANPEYGVTDIAVCDCDADGSREVLWGAGYVCIRRPQLFVRRKRLTSCNRMAQHGLHRALQRPLGWRRRRRRPARAALRQPAIGQRPGWSVVRSRRCHQSARVSERARFQRKPEPELWRVRHANVDADPQQEIFVTSRTWSAPMLFCYDGLDARRAMATRCLNGRGPVNALDHGDVAGDGILELVAASGARRPAARIPRTARSQWQPVLTTTSYTSMPFLRLADVDGDSSLEIVAAVAGGFVLVIDRRAGTIGNLGDHDVSALDVVELDHVGVAEIVVGTTSGDHPNPELDRRDRADRRPLRGRDRRSRRRRT